VVEEAAPNVISSNDENALLVYLGAQPNTNPLYVDMVASGRHDFVPTSVIIDPMNALNDPRRPFYFTQIDTSTVAGIEKLAYVGGVYGSGNDFTAYSHVADAIQEPTFPGDIFDYSEVEFLMAEAVERGYNVGGTAEAHYNKAILASVLFWGGTAEEAATYLAQPEVAYATATGTWQEKIGTQKWFAMYNRGFESWTDWRRYDYPLLVPGVDAQSGIPVRYSYPISEQTINAVSYNAASAAIGGDDVATKLFFDKH
jgi:hypothetical protein